MDQGQTPPVPPPPDGVTAGMTLAITVALAAVAGIWLDRRLGCMPLFTLLLTFCGVGLGGSWLYLRVLRPQRRDEQPRR